MKKSPVVRWQLLVLGAVTFMLLFRVLSGPPEREGLVVIENMKTQSLEHRALEVDHAITVAIEGRGAFETDRAAEPALAAYAWVTNRGSRNVVWRMDPETNVNREGGTSAYVEDTMRLPAGHYDVYFASFGNQLATSNGRALIGRFLNGDANWQKDHRKWYIVLTLLDGKETDARGVSHHEEETRFAQGERVIWDSGPMEDDRHEEFVFRVSAPTPVRIRTIGELGHDRGQIVNLLTDEVVWEMNRENSEYAGGAEQNRRAEADLELTPGLYRASYQTDATHAYQNWLANPPYDPEGWGISLTSKASVLAAHGFDVWNEREPAVAILGVQNDEFEAVTFTVTQPERMLVSGLGEMKSNDRYDFGWIERAAAVGPFAGRTDDEDDRKPHSDATVWEMTYEDSSPAGGDRSNRRVQSFIDLPASTYTMYYRTDESQAFGSWSNGEPENGERWGIALFTLTDENAGDVQVLNRERWRPEVPRPPAPNFEVRVQVEVPREARPIETLQFDEEDVLAALNRLENNEQVVQSLNLQESTRLYIVAAGEITLSGERYDYGFIERVSDGKVVWEMTWNNTKAAGGDDSNRIFDGEIELPAGNYNVRFTTDGTHSYNHFDTGAPEIPEAWGITVARPR